MVYLVYYTVNLGVNVALCIDFVLDDVHGVIKYIIVIDFLIVDKPR